MASQLRETGQNSRFISFLEREEKETEQHICLGGHAKLTIGGLRRLYRSKLEGRFSARASIYHNCWGLDFLADLDPSELRIGFLHSSVPRLEKFLRYYVRFADGFIFVNEEMLNRSRQIIVDWAESRFAYFPHVLQLPEYVGSERKDPREEIIIGYAGRLSIKQKRIDRIPSFLRLLDQKLPGCRFEILGSGPDEGWLRKKLSGRTNVRFHGWREGDDYWRVLRSWNYTVFFSDYEGLPVVLLEALACGIVPLYPDFYGGRDYLGRIDSTLLYRPGDMKSLVHALCAAKDWPTDHRDQFFEKSHALMKEHAVESLDGRYKRFLGGVADTLPVSRRNRKPPPAMLRMAPVWICNRWMRWRFRN